MHRTTLRFLFTSEQRAGTRKTIQGPELYYHFRRRSMWCPSWEHMLWFIACLLWEVKQPLVMRQSSSTLRMPPPSSHICSRECIAPKMSPSLKKSTQKCMCVSLHLAMSLFSRALFLDRHFSSFNYVLSNVPQKFILKSKNPFYKNYSSFSFTSFPFNKIEMKWFVVQKLALDWHALCCTLCSHVI